MRAAIEAAVLSPDTRNRQRTCSQSPKRLAICPELERVIRRSDHDGTTRS
jgi:hypothetical protein